MHIYLKWGTNVPQVEMIIQIIVPLLAHSGTSYNLMETRLKIIWYVHVFWIPNGFFRTEKTTVLPLPFSQTVLPEIVLTSKAHNLTLNSVLFSFRKITSCTFR